jgi:hypothetical protein
MTRRSTWEADLSAYLIGMADARFAYGQIDCALFAAGAVEAMTGEDPAARFRGKYKTMRGSLSALSKLGSGTLEATLDAMFSEKPVPFAGRGDLVFHDGSVGVVVGGDALFLAQDGGLTRVPRASWLKAWSV